ncbi:hypothetical protein ACP70R_010641 [Stipagrostis hirtigluma subsp. patula]
MEEESCVPPGFRFHPTEEELVGYYLARKVASQKIDLEIIQEVDLYRIEPWDLQARCKYVGGQEEQTEWYFFSYKDRKYPSGTRTNRATAAGFWKATGRDKPVLSRSRVIGMRKTLVFYKGRAPNGRKTDWIMHEYRLQSNEHAPAQEEGWVVCRAFQKPIPNQRPFFPTGTYAAAAGYYDHLPNARLHVDGDHHFLGSALHHGGPPAAGVSSQFPHLYYSDDMESKKHLFSIPPLESPTALAGAPADAYLTQKSSNNSEYELIQQGGQALAAGAIDWNFLDTLLSTTSQLQESSSSLQ